MPKVIDNLGRTKQVTTVANIPSGLVQSGAIASGAVIGSSGGGAFTIASGTISQNDIAAGGVASGNYASGSISQLVVASGLFALGSGNWLHNKLVNGGMSLAQRQTPATLTAITSGASATDTYSADRFKCAVNSGGMVLYQRWDRLASGFASGADARYYGRWVMGGSGKFALYQPIETVNSQPLGNKWLSFQIKCRGGAASSGLIVKMGVLQTNSGVATDTIPNSLVSGWSLATSGTDPTWGSGVALLAPSTVVIPTSGIWGIFVNNGFQAISGHVCLIPTIWANQPLASGVQFDMTEVGLYCD